VLFIWLAAEISGVEPMRCAPEIGCGFGVNCCYLSLLEPGHMPRVEGTRCSVLDEGNHAVTMALTRWYIDTRPLWPDDQDVTSFAAVLTISLAPTLAGTAP
jgi:hypothetical protein